MAAYHVYTESGGNLTRVFANVEAESDREAIRKAVGSTGTYIALGADLPRYKHVVSGAAPFTNDEVTPIYS